MNFETRVQQSVLEKKFHAIDLANVAVKMIQKMTKKYALLNVVKRQSLEGTRYLFQPLFERMISNSAF